MKKYVSVCIMCLCVRSQSLQLLQFIKRSSFNCTDLVLHQMAAIKMKLEKKVSLVRTSGMKYMRSCPDAGAETGGEDPAEPHTQLSADFLCPRF